MAFTLDGRLQCVALTLEMQFLMNINEQVSMRYPDSLGICFSKCFGDWNISRVHAVLS